MGQAKRRGSKEQRKAQAEQRMKDLMPDFLTCNNCNEKIEDLVPMPTNGVRGIEVACVGLCKACGQETWGVNGDPQAVEAFTIAMTEGIADKDLKVGLESIKSH